MKAWAILFLCFASAAMAAEANGTPYDLYAAGRYDAAIRAGTEAGDAEGYAIAARAALAEEMMRDAPCLDCLKTAEQYARRAAALDPENPEAHIYVAVALGYEARILGLVSARLHNFPDKAKTELDAALADDPKDPWALAALGGWNIEIVRGGGAVLAKLFYGATVAKGLADFTAALDGLPGNVTLCYQYALSLSGYDAARFHAQIADALSCAAKGAPVTAYDRMAQAHARRLSDLLAADADGKYAALVRKYQGYP